MTSSWFLWSFTLLKSSCAFLVWDGTASEQTAGTYSISLSPLAVSSQLLPFVLVTVDLQHSSSRFDLVVATGSFITTLAVRFGNSGFATQQLQKLLLVSIAFKLVQRTNSLNMLFKMAVYVSLMLLILIF